MELRNKSPKPNEYQRHIVYTSDKLEHHSDETLIVFRPDGPIISLRGAKLAITWQDSENKSHCREFAVTKNNVKPLGICD